MRKLAALTLGLILLSSTFIGCGAKTTDKDTTTTTEPTQAAATAEPTQAAATTQAPSTEVTKVKVGVSTESMPNAYVDENGKCAGENYEVMCLVDNMLPQYEFEYEPVSQETIIVGLDSGTYAVGISNFFYNDERAEKYLFPEYPVSGGVKGLILSSEYKDKIKSGTTEEVLAQFAKLGLEMVPIGADESAFTMFNDFNKSHDDQIKFTVTEETNVSTSTQYIMQGRYDGSMFLASNYDAVKDQVDPDGKTFFLPFTDGGFGTWVLYNKQQADLVKAIDGCMEKLYADGTMAAISEKYYGENVFQYINDFKFASVEPNPSYK